MSGMALELRMQNQSPITSTTAPPSPGRLSFVSTTTIGDQGFYFSEPTSPVHAQFQKFSDESQNMADTDTGGFEFEFSGRYPHDQDWGIPSAEELFCNGQIRTLNAQNISRISPHYTPILQDQGPVSCRSSVDSSENACRPTKTTLKSHLWQDREQKDTEKRVRGSRSVKYQGSKSKGGAVSNSWSAIKDLLYMNRSSSEGRADTREEMQVGGAVSPAMQAQKHSLKRSNQFNKGGASEKALGRERGAPRERRNGVPVEFQCYAGLKNNRIEERRKSYLPYRNGLLGCLGFRTSIQAFSPVPALARNGK